MCKKLTVAYGDFIGKRLIGWCVFNGKDFSFMSDKQIKTRMDGGDKVHGLKLGEDGAVVMDKSFTPYLMGKSGLSFNPIEDGGDVAESLNNKYYSLYKVSNTKAGAIYHCVTSRCGLEEFTADQLKSMLGLVSMGGVTLGEAGELVVHEGVDDEPAPQATTEGESVVEEPKGKIEGVEEKKKGGQK